MATKTNAAMSWPAVMSTALGGWPLYVTLYWVCAFRATGTGPTR